jgi:hypothetical protein
MIGCGGRSIGRWFQCRFVIRSRGEQYAGIGMVGRCQYLGGGADFADVAPIHHRDTVRELCDDRKIVRDEQVG